MNEDRDRIEAHLKNKNQEFLQAERKAQDQEYEIESFKRKLFTLETRANEANEMSEKIFQNESKMNQMNMKIEALSREVQEGEQIKY